MKKILILLLISSVPIMSIAQKRSKKSKKEQTTQSSSENVLIIKITEIIKPLSATRGESAGDVTEMELVKQAASNDTRVIVNYDFGRAKYDETEMMVGMSREISTISEAINMATKYGWKLSGSNLVKSSNSSFTHYIYMRK